MDSEGDGILPPGLVGGLASQMEGSSACRRLKHGCKAQPSRFVQKSRSSTIPKFLSTSTDMLFLNAYFGLLG